MQEHPIAASGIALCGGAFVTYKAWNKINNASIQASEKKKNKNKRIRDSLCSECERNPEAFKKLTKCSKEQYPFADLVVHRRDINIFGHVTFQEKANREDLTSEERRKITTKFKNFYFLRRTVWPKKHAGGPKILLVCVHGTLSNPDSFGGNRNRETSKEIDNLACQLAYVYNVPVEILCLGWSGRAIKKDREAAAHVLASKLRKEFAEYGQINNIKQVWTLAHSHGCNVVNMALDELSDIRTVDVAIQIASPQTDLPLSKAKNGCFNAKKEIHIYGSSDSIQVIGSAVSHGSKRRKLPGYIKLIERPDGNKEVRRLWNVRLQKDGRDRNHFNIKLHAIRHIIDFLYCIDTYYNFFTDLDANVFEDKIKLPQICIRRNYGIASAGDWLWANMKLGSLYSEMQNDAFKSQYDRDMYRKYSGWDHWSLLPFHGLSMFCKEIFPSLNTRISALCSRIYQKQFRT